MDNKFNFRPELKHDDNKKWLELAWNNDDISEDEVEHPYGIDDAVNSPSHYTRGKVEAIEVIEDAIQDAPTVKAGFLQAQTLKYMLRLWLKVDAKEDAEKARWYLNRLIDSLD